MEPPETCTFGLSPGSEWGGTGSRGGVFWVESGLCDSALSLGGLDLSRDTARVRRPTGEGVKNLESPSISPLVFLLTASGAEVGVRVCGVGEEEEEEEEVISTAQRGPLVSVTDAA